MFQPIATDFGIRNTCLWTFDNDLPIVGLISSSKTSGNAIIAERGAPSRGRKWSPMLPP